MKHINKILALFIAVALFSCEDEYVEPNKFSDVSWYTSQFTSTAGNLMGVGDYGSFSNLSQGYNAHRWELLDDSCYFLNGPITNKDTAYDEFIDAGKGKISEDKTIHVLFNSAGIKRVRLYNEFSEAVTFRGWDTVSAISQVGNKWVMDTVFEVDVYDTIAAEFKVFGPNGDEITLGYGLDSTDWPVYEIEAGQAINYVDMSTQGRPNDRTWRCNGGTPYASADSSAIVIYTRLGEFTSVLESKRTGPTLPYGYNRVEIPLKIQVNPSSLPFEIIGEGVELEDQTIQLMFNGEFDQFSGQEEFFTVNVRNSGSGFNKDVSIQSVAANSAIGSMLEITLGEAIYNTDIITISYTGGDLVSVDSRDLSPFAGVGVDMHKANILNSDVYGFENDHANWASKGPEYTGEFELSTERSYDGDFSMKLTGSKGNNVGIQNELSTDGLFHMEKGKSYTFSYWYYIEGPSSNLIEYTSYLMPTTGWEETKVWTNGGSKDKWALKTALFEDFGGVADSRYLFVRMLHSADETDGVPSIMYIDDIQLYESELRPE